MARRRRVAARAAGGSGLEEPTPRPAHPSPRDTQPAGFTPAEVAGHLDISPDALDRLRLRFARYLSRGAAAADARFVHADVATLVMLQRLLDQGYDDGQIAQALTPPPVPTSQAEDADAVHAATALATTHSGGEPSEAGTGLARLVGDAMNTLAGTQQAVLNSQSSLREMLNVVVQDNFNLKDENRKLRDRMLELERALAEYQRREETRKERSESRLRALEATVAALQQQIAQLVQLQRQQQRRRGWFG